MPDGKSSDTCAMGMLTSPTTGGDRIVFFVGGYVGGGVGYTQEIHRYFMFTINLIDIHFELIDCAYVSSSSSFLLM